MSVTQFWPEGYQCAVTITVNFDGESVEQKQLPGEPLWGRYSFGRYGAQIGAQRILDLLDRFGVRATFFIPAWDVERYPHVMEQIAKAGHELAGHGYAHEDFSALNPAQQREVLDQSESIFERAFGAKPAGWRAPDGLMTSETRNILAARGYRYDSSYCDDDLPYLAAEANGNRLVELPVFSSASDRYYYPVHRAPGEVAAALSEEFRAMYEVGGLSNLTIHPRGDYGSGRGVRIRALQSVLQTIREHPQVWLATCKQVADWTLESKAGNGRA